MGLIKSPTHYPPPLPKFKWGRPPNADFYAMPRPRHVLPGGGSGRRRGAAATHAGHVRRRCRRPEDFATERKRRQLGKQEGKRKGGRTSICGMSPLLLLRVVRGDSYIFIFIYDSGPCACFLIYVGWVGPRAYMYMCARVCIYICLRIHTFRVDIPGALRFLCDTFAQLYWRRNIQHSKIYRKNSSSPLFFCVRRDSPRRNGSQKWRVDLFFSLPSLLDPGF